MSINPTDPGIGPLAQVQEGMAVYDAGNNKIGTVRSVQMSGGNDPVEVDQQRRDAGASDTDTSGVGPLGLLGGTEGGATSGMVGAAGTAGTGGETLGGNLFGGFLSGDQIPDELRQKLERQGFIRIDSAGLFAADRFATPDQIAQVTEDGVVLNVAGDALVKG